MMCIDPMNVDPLNICSRYDEQRTDLPGDNTTTAQGLEYCGVCGSNYVADERGTANNNC